MNVNAVTRILLIEDDKIASKTLGSFLEKQGLYVEYEASGRQAVQHILDMNPDAVVLDLMLPGKDGLQICREVRAGYRGPILMLTARHEDLDQILGLELGADDYITKPANPRVVLARMRACLRRVEENAGLKQDRDELVYGQFRINRATREVHLGENEIDLTAAEFDMLWLLAINAGRHSVSRPDPLEAAQHRTRWCRSLH